MTTQTRPGSAVSGHGGQQSPDAGELALAVRQGSELAPGETPEMLRITTPRWSQQIKLGDPALVRSVVTLQEGPRPQPQLLLETTQGSGGIARAGVLQAVLAKLQQAAVLDHVLLDATGTQIARLTGEGTLPVTLSRAAPTRGALSPLAVITTDGGRAVVQSGLSHLKVVLDPTTVARVLAGDVLDSPGDGATVARFLDSAGVWDIEPATDREHRQWNAADLWVHRRAHESAASDAYGGTFHLADEFEPLDFARPRAERTLTLPTPDLEAIRERDLPLAEVVERRRSIRDFADEDPSLAELGELLYRTCRARGVFREERGGDVVDRPFPSGGSVHELDVHIVAPGSAELDRGLWRYAADRHELDLLSDDESHVAVMVKELQTAAMLERPAPFGILITARFGRLLWKYQSMAYALLLKHVGVLYQTLYLNATAMGLGVCGLGGASTGQFATATGASPLAEGVVGGLVAGRPGSVPESPWSAT